MFLDLTDSDATWREAYRLCIGFVAPRPIALVSTVSPRGVANLAPYSFYNMVCARPPIVMFSSGARRDGTLKHSLRNAEASGEFVVATATAAFASAMVSCAADLEYEHSEFDFSGLTPKPARFVRAPLVAESPVNIECRVHQITRLGDGPGSAAVVFGRIVAVHVDPGVLTEAGEIDPHRLHTVGRLGGEYYVNAEQPYVLKIPKPT